MRILILLLALAVSACATGHEPPKPAGALFQLNPDKWTAHTNDLTTEPTR